MTSINKADFAHIDVYVRGKLRILSSPEEMPIFNGYGNDNQQLKELLSKSKLSEEILSFFEDMHTKLEHIIALLEEKKLEDIFPINIEAVNLSGSEVLFKTPTPLTIGTMVEVVLPLSQMPFKVAGGIGRIDSKKISDGGDIWKLSFTRIREQDLETIVQFVFQQERKRIREIRWE